MDAQVTLSAIDNVTGPTSSAIASLQKYQATSDMLGSSSSMMGESALYAAAGIKASGDASEASVTPHRAAHQALALVSSSLVDVAGGSAAAQAGVRVLDSVMFQMAVTGMGVSLEFIAIVAAAAALGYAFKSTSEEAKKNAEELDRMTASAIKAAEGLDTLDKIQRGVAGVGAATLGVTIAKLKGQIGDLTAEMEKNAAAVKAGVLGGSSGFMGQMSQLSGLMSGNILGQSGSGAANEAQLKNAENLRILQEELRKAQVEQQKLILASSKYTQVLADQDNPLTTFANKMERQAQILINQDATLTATGMTFQQVGAWAEKMGMDSAKAFQVIVNQEAILKTATETLAQDFGQTLGNAIMGAKNAWQDGLKSMIGAVFDAATQVVLAAAVMNEAISASLIPGTFAGILGMVVVLQAMKQVAISALSSASSNLNAAGASSVPTSSIGGPSGSPTTTTGVGGSAVSSAQSQITNNVTVKLDVEAMDLSSVSDIQLKDLATRVGRILAEASGQGQFSLVGA